MWMASARQGDFHWRVPWVFKGGVCELSFLEAWLHFKLLSWQYQLCFSVLSFTFPPFYLSLGSIDNQPLGRIISLCHWKVTMTPHPQGGSFLVCRVHTGGKTWMYSRQADGRLWATRRLVWSRTKSLVPHIGSSLVEVVSGSFVLTSLGIGTPWFW